LAVVVVFALLWLAASGRIELVRWFGVCGFKQRYGLPCPTCGITTSALAFVQGQVWRAFWIQPAGGLLCCGLVAAAFFAFVTAVFGVYFAFLKHFFARVKVRDVILVLIVVIVAGWAVTLSRALAAG